LKGSSILPDIDGSIWQTPQTALAGKKQPGAEQRLATTVEAHGNRFAFLLYHSVTEKYIVISL
jgi:hypothetical protein